VILAEVVLVDMEEVHRQVKDTPTTGHVIHMTHLLKVLPQLQH